ncbi:MAG: hypothetical protein AB2693_11510 [Candidatus Thiodiazotropha sp.]
MVQLNTQSMADNQLYERRVMEMAGKETPKENVETFVIHQEAAVRLRGGNSIILPHG